MQLSLPLLFVLFGVFYLVISTLMQRKSDKTFAFTEFVKEINSPGNTPLFSERYFKPLLMLVNSKIRLDKSERERLAEQLESANSNKTPEMFVTQRIVYSALFGIFFLIMYLLSLNPVILGLGVISATIMYFYPKYALKNNVEFAKAMRKVELPDYLTPMGLLMYSYTAHQAVKQAEKFAGPYLQPYVEKLSVEIDMYPGSSKPFVDFANRLGIPEAQTFVIAIQQAINTDPKRSRVIIQKQVDLMRRLREESYNELINKKPIQMNKYNGLILFNMALLPLSTLVFIIGEVFTAI